MFGENSHLRTLGPAPSCAKKLPQPAPKAPTEPSPALPPEYFRELLTPRCKRDGVCDDCGMCGH